tara:strand:+ start:730 stop:1446 length:717 start_codon:yes stop_codon:yes gene_type:complete
MSEMKLILESWRGYVNEVEESDPVTYGQFGALLKLFLGAKQGLKSDALVAATGIGKFFSSDEAKLLLNFAGKLFTESKESDSKNLLLEEPITIAAVIGLGKAIAAGAPVAKATFDLGKKLYKKYKNEPTSTTDKAPFLDLFNVDPKYSAMLDDRIEEEFLKAWLGNIQSKPENDVMDSTDLDVNLQLQNFVQNKFERGISGHTAPGLSVQTQGDLKKAAKDIKKRSAVGTAQKIATAE